MRFYHVADPRYRAGEPLYSWAELELRGNAPVCRWTEDPADYADTDVVSLFATRAQAEQWIADGYAVSGSHLLTVDLPNDVQVLTNGEGCPCVLRLIPAEHIRKGD